MSNRLELRMYGLVPYNISPIQQAIQFGHAVVEYGQNCKKPFFKTNMAHNSMDIYNEWADNWKTFIILNGGTTNIRNDKETGFPFGSLNRHALTLIDQGIDVATFHEPDLGDQLTAVVFIVDERVFNREKYPDFPDWIMQNYLGLINGVGTLEKIAQDLQNSSNPDDKKIFNKWVDLIGGEKNIFLRQFLSKFKLA